jgi:hypothetical protein
MQSLSVLPPPPGALGVDPLGLPPGDKARVLPDVVPPVENWVGSCGESGATGGTCCVGGSVEEGDVDGLAVVTGALVVPPPVATPLGLVAVAPAPVERV